MDSKNFFDSKTVQYVLIFVAFLIGLLIGLLIGVGISGTIEFFDNTIKSLDQLDPSLIVLGIIPSIGPGKKNKKGFDSRR